MAKKPNSISTEDGLMILCTDYFNVCLAFFIFKTNTTLSIRLAEGVLRKLKANSSSFHLQKKSFV